MFDGLYTRLTGVVPYKVLVFIPPVVSLLMVGLLLVNGIELGIDFKGGTWIEILTDRSLDDGMQQSLENELASSGLSEPKVHTGLDIESRKQKVTIVTTSVIEGSDIKDIVEKYTGTLTEADTAKVPLSKKPPVELSDKLSERLNEYVAVEYADGTLTVTALELDEEKLERALEFYLGKSVDAKIYTKNYNSRTVGATLGETFKKQGIKAIIAAYILMSIMVAWAFKDLVPSLAVVVAATCDAVIALGCMSILNIPLEPASLAALLMLIGYSVDSDILLTVRVLKRRGEEVDERIDDAMKTGLTMTFTTLSVMLVVLVVSSQLTHMTTLYNIALVLFLGLAADLTTTWFTNAGILKWYLEGPRGRGIR